MKLNYTIYSLAVAAFFMVSCSADNEAFNIEAENGAMQQQQQILFPEEDGSKALSGQGTYRVRKIIESISDTNYTFTRNIKQISITDAQYNEIENFTKELVKECKSDKEKYDKAFQWIRSNVKYAQGWVDNSPYAVFKTKEAICQGYADLLTIMMHTQNIPCITVNGDLYQPGTSAFLGGHAWNYVFVGKWYISDPTNGGSFLISSMSSYSHLRPTHIFIPIFEDEDFQYNYYESHLNICSIKSDKEQIVIPYSKNGIRVTSANPSVEVPASVKEIYIGKNITTLGVNSLGLEYLAPSVEHYYVDPENNVLESFSNVIYKKSGGKYEMYLVAQSVKDIELKAIENIDKESKIKKLPKLETIVFVPGTKSIGSWAIENCPNLHTAYIPEDTQVDNNAFVGVAKDFKIVRGNYTNIPQIKY